MVARAAPESGRCNWSSAVTQGFGDADDTDGDTPAGVAGRLRLEVVGFLVNDQATADDRRGTVEAEARIIEIDGGFAVRVGRDVAQITNMALGRVDPSM